MYVLNSATASNGGTHNRAGKEKVADGGTHDPAAKDRAAVYDAFDRASEQFQTVIYLDSRALTRDCMGLWLQNNLSGFGVCVLRDPDEIEGASIASDQIRAIVIHTGLERMSSPAVARLLSRVSELLPAAPVAILSDYEDTENIREALDLGVRGYIPTSLASMVAVGAIHLVCVGGTFAPAASLLSQSNVQHHSGERLVEGFTQRQSQILDCLRRGMANKLIAYELSMCESTVKVHIRNIMKKLNATNRTQVAYMTRGLFEGSTQYRESTRHGLVAS